MSNKTACTVLIIDDSPEDRHTYTSYMREFEDLNITILEAGEADEGLRTCKQVDIDCVLLDYELPDMNGVEFLQALHNEANVPQIPVVMITGRGSEMVAVDAMKSGAIDYLIKAKVTRESLYRAVRNAIERSFLMRELQAETREREYAETELRDSESRFRMLVASVAEYAIVMLDQDGNISSWNAGARRLLNYHDQEVIGRHVRTLFTPEDARARAAETELQRADVGPATTERWFVRRDGSRFWASGMMAPIIDSVGVRCGYSLVMRDMTERRQAQARLDVALKTRDDFTSIASHALRTPLTGLMLQMQLLLRRLQRGETPPYDEIVGRLQNGTHQLKVLARMVDSLLGYNYDEATPQGTELKSAEAPHDNQPSDRYSV